MSIRSLLRDTVLRTSQTKFGAGTEFTLDTDLAWPTVISTFPNQANAVTWSSDGNYYYTVNNDRVFQYSTPYVYGPVEKSILIASTPDYTFGGPASSIQLSIDGTKMYTVSGTNI
jgi:hypothetical protein